MSGNDKYDNDDYVAQLLAEDAKKSSQRYASAGLSALLAKRSSKVAPKPNTRFLTHLVREVDSHNAALKKKEELEAKIRLKDLKERDSRYQAKADEGRERKRRRVHEDSEQSHRRKRSRDRRRSASPQRHNGDTEKQRSKASDSRLEQRRHKSRSRSPRGEGHDEGREKFSRRHRDRTSHKHREERRHHQRSHKSPSSSPGHSPSRHKRSSRHYKHGRPSRARSRSPTPRSTDSSTISSDPLEPFINPNSKPQIRGRGGQASTTSTSNIDRHFSTTYDPAMDVCPFPSPSGSPDPDQDRSDWDLALSALRDRAKWKRTQAQRLRDAGFEEEEIRKWEKRDVLGRDKDGDVRDVRWTKRGEAREWDLGKKGVGD